MKEYLQPAYWVALLQSIREWLLTEVLVPSSLLELFALILALGLGMLAARPFKPWFAHYIERPTWKDHSLGRFLEAFRSLSSIIFAVVLLGVAYAVFRRPEAAAEGK